MAEVQEFIRISMHFAAAVAGCLLLNFAVDAVFQPYWLTRWAICVPLGFLWASFVLISLLRR